MVIKLEDKEIVFRIEDKKIIFIFIIYGTGVYLANVKLLSLIYSIFLILTLLYRFIGTSYLKRTTKLFIKDNYVLLDSKYMKKKKIYFKDVESLGYMECQHFSRQFL